ncbi:MAG: Uma2 family endonuclease [Chloroflexi bacterium AL-N10]|nr:Uma2 family endonuclease [Chloroflexi bacterium AL-N10]NOK92758.1 Uma2 family endonuclease [Chloroflexi bacterium AL-N15]
MKTIFKWSLLDWHRLVDSGILADKAVELLAGEIIEMSPEGIDHSYTNHTVVEYLRELLNTTAVVRQALPVTLNNSEPQPDIAVVRLPATMYATHHPFAEDIYWLIEISKTTLGKDLNEKQSIYASNGIPEYWVIDLVEKKVWVFTQPEGDRYCNLVALTTGIINPTAFPNIVVNCDRLLVT